MRILKILFSKSNKEIANKQMRVYKSEIPEYINSANKIYNKEYDSAIDDLKKQLNKVSQTNFRELSMIHINLMQAYFKKKDSHLEYFELSTQHAKEALKCGHNTGLAPYRLIVNLEKEQKINQAIEVCNLVTDDNYAFSIHGYKQKNEFVERLKKLEAKLKITGDSNTELLFTDAERVMALKNSKINKITA